jgi:aspartyl/glutamyl-tRNA(Asn/Gln) amidotransferase C subunit
MAISKEEVLHVARLARLALTDEEVERLGAQLNAILEAVGKVSELEPLRCRADGAPARARQRLGRGRAA